MTIRTIVLVVIDCLRADHVSCYGYDRPTTPTLDALATQGVLWEQAYSTSSWTKPSVTSMLTGLYPSEHGAFEGIKRSKNIHTVRTDVLNTSTPTLAQCLGDSGWRCGAFINNAQLGPFSRLDRGFHEYHPQAGKADRLLESFERWLKTNDGHPVFAYLHFLEAHWPYKPRRRHIAMFGGNRDTNMFRDFSAWDYGRLRRAVSRKERELSDVELEQLVQMYDGAVRRLDGKLKVVQRLLEEARRADKAALIVTADHGEEFLEHGRIGHGQGLYDELTHVPLVISIPGGPRGVRRKEPVSQVNLAYTLARMAGVEVGLSGGNLLSGDDGGRGVCCELRIKQRYTQTIRKDRWKLLRTFKFERKEESVDPVLPMPQWVAAYPHRCTSELYDVRDDPREQNDLADAEDYAEAGSRLSAELDAWWHGLDTGGRCDAGEVELNPKVVERLRALGYLE